MRDFSAFDLEYYAELDVDNVAELVDAMLNDLEDAYSRSRATPYDRRIWVRTCWSCVEGLIYAASSTILRIHRATTGRPKDVKAKRADVALELLLVDCARASLDGNYLKHEDPALDSRLRFVVNVLNSYQSKLDKSAAKIQFPAEYSAAKKVRNRITHPKGMQDLFVSQEDVEASEVVFSEIGKIVSRCFKAHVELIDGAKEHLKTSISQ